MSEEVNLNEVYEWARKEDKLWEFLENIKWNILAEHPNKFVTIKEIAEKLNWQFDDYDLYIHKLVILCLPLTFSADMEIECRENKENSSLSAYKYKPEADTDMMSKSKSYYEFKNESQDTCGLLTPNWRGQYYLDALKIIAETYKKEWHEKESEKNEELSKKEEAALKQVIDDMIKEKKSIDTWR